MRTPAQPPGLVRPPSGRYADPPPAPVSAESGKLGLSVVTLFLFIVVARVSEVIADALGTSMKMVLLLTIAGIAISFVSGRMGYTLQAKGSIALFAFTSWWLICIPFSVWPGGSVALLREQWMFSIAAFIVIATVAVSPRALNKYAGAMAWAAIFVNFVLLRYGTMEESRGSLEFAGTLSNPNIAALQLLLGLPFLVYWIRTRGFFSFKGLLGASSAILLCFLIVTRTGSRSGLMIMVVLAMMMLSGIKLHIKAGLILTILVAAAVVIPLVPSYLLYRYSTLLSSESNDTSEAAQSSRERKALLWQSVIMTLENPIVGVGAGQFRVAASDVSKLAGDRAMWLESHNMYTQISSETGVPGIVLYLTIIWFSLAPVWRDLRRARRSGQILPRHEFARALLISATGLLLNSIFTSVAYQYYWPIMCSLGIAYQQVASLEKSEPQTSVPAALKPPFGPNALSRSATARRTSWS